MAVNGGKSAEIEEETWSDINVILQKDAEDNMDGTREQRGSSRENGKKRKLILRDSWNFYGT